MKGEEAYGLVQSEISKITSGGVAPSNTVTSVNNKIGVVTLSKVDIGLANVSNDTQIPLSQKGVANGVATLDTSGKVPISNIPVGLVNIVTVSNEAARLALPLSTNLTLALQADTKIEWAINANTNPSISSNWVNCGSYSAAVASVNGSTGAITLNHNSLPNIEGGDTTHKYHSDQPVNKADSVEFASIKFGSSSPAIKMKKYTGTMPSLGQSTYMSHGLDQSKIISFSCIVSDPENSLRMPNSTIGQDIEYYTRIKSDNTIWLTSGGNATLIAGRPFKVVVTYEA